MDILSNINFLGFTNKEPDIYDPIKAAAETNNILTISCIPNKKPDTIKHKIKLNIPTFAPKFLLNPKRKQVY